MQERIEDLIAEHSIQSGRFVGFTWIPAFGCTEEGSVGQLTALKSAYQRAPRVICRAWRSPAVTAPPRWAASGLNMV